MNITDKIKQIRIEDYDYPLKNERIAKHPVSPRDTSNLLVYREGNISKQVFKDIDKSLPQNSILVYNNTKVIHARLHFKKVSGAKIEIFCLEPISPADFNLNFSTTQTCDWKCFVGNLKKWKETPLLRTIIIDSLEVELKAEKIEKIENSQIIRFSWKVLNAQKHINFKPVTFAHILEKIGQIPIPPYLNRDSEKRDETDYQTVYSKIEGSVAAPTAGLHFTPKVLENIDKKGIKRMEVTLHVGAGTFKPVQSEKIEGHIMHHEFIYVQRELIETLIENQGKITAVGTTSVRTLESLYWFGHQMATGVYKEGQTLLQWYPYEQNIELSTKKALQALLDYMDINKTNTFTDSTQLLIAPGYNFKVVNNMITNFHQPKSTLLLLVSAFLKGEEWKRVYKFALENNFRFLSYGDSCFFIPKKE